MTNEQAEKAKAVGNVIFEALGIIGVGDDLTVSVAALARVLASYAVGSGTPDDVFALANGVIEHVVHSSMERHLPLSEQPRLRSAKARPTAA